LDEDGWLWILSVNGALVKLKGWIGEVGAHYLKGVSEVTSDREGTFQLGNDMVYIKGENSIMAYTRTNIDKKWETSVSGTFYDFQWYEKENELVIPNYGGNTVTLIEGGENGGSVIATKDIGHKSGQVAIDKYG